MTKDTLMTSIAENVEKIEKSRSQFGTKLPGNKNKNDERTLQELSYEQMIMGTLGSLVWGAQNITKDTQVKTLLGNQNNIFNLVESIKNSIESLNENISQVVQGGSSTNVSSGITGDINIHIDNLDSFSELVDKLGSTLGDKKSGAIVGLKSLVEFLQILDSEEITKYKDTAQKNIVALNNLLGNPEDESSTAFSFAQLIKRINIICSGFNTVDITGLSDIIDTIIKVLSLESKTINLEGLGLLIGVTDPKNGPIHKLIQNLSAVEQLTKEKEQTFKSIEAFFTAITSLGDIGFIKRRKIKSNIEYINKHIIDMIPDLAKKLQKVADENEKSALTAIGNLSALFNAMVEIGNLDFKHKIKLLINLQWMSKVYIKSIISILKSLQSAINSNGEATAKALEALSKLFDEVIKIGDLSFIKLLKLEMKMDMMHDIISENVVSVLAAISSLSTDDAVKRIIDLNKVFEGINKIYNSTPGVKDSLFENIKLSMLYDNADSLNEIINFLNTIPFIQNQSLFGQDIPTTFGDIMKLFGEKPSDKFTLLHELDDDLKIFKNDIIVKINGIIEIINSMNTIKRTTWINSLKKILKEFDTTQPESIGSYIVYLPNKDELKNFLATGIALKSFSASMVNLEKLEEEQTNNANALLELAKTIVEKFEPVNGEIGKNLNDIDEKNLTKIDTMIKLMEKVAKLGKIKFVLNISKKTMDTMAALANPLKKFVESLAEIKDEDVKKAKDIINTYFKVVIGGAAILLLAGIVMKKINIIALAAFTVLLSGFLFAVALTLKIAAKSLKDELKIAKDIILLIMACGGIMILASLISKYIDVGGLLGFTAMLGLFLFSVGLVFILFKKAFKESMEGVYDAIILIGYSAAILLAGGLIMRLIRPEDLIIFTLTLATFLFAVSLAFLVFKFVGKEVMQGAKEAAILIGVAGGILIAGGLFMRIIKPKDLVLFTLTLGVFLFATSLIFLIFKQSMKEVAEGATGAALIIAVSAGVMILGALFMKDLKRAIGALAFTVLLAGFIFLVIWAYKRAAKDLALAMPTAIAFAILTVVSATILLVGAYILMKQPKLILFAIAFGLLFAAFTWIMIKALKKLTQNSKNVWGGVGVMVALGIVTVLMAYALKEAVKAANMVQDWWTFVGTVGVMALVIYGLYAMARALGQAGPEALGYIAIGEAIIAGLVGIVWLVGKAVSSIAEGIEDLARVSHADLDFVNLALLLLEFNYLTGPLLGLAAMLPVVGLASLSMLALRSFLFDAADIVQAYASLTIPIYDENGKLVGKKIMSEKDIEKSMKNTHAVVTALFSTIKEIYDANPEMFAFSISSLLSGGGGTVFGKVAAAGKGLAAMLSQLAVAVQDWCDLKIPIYQGEKIIGYKTIDNDAFVKAGENIKAVVTCLAQAILDVYDNAPDKDMFEPSALGLFGPSKFSKVTRAIGTMGDALSDIASGIKDWADLKIPIYKPGSTEISGYHTIADKDFIKAGEHIKEVVTLLANTILDIYAEAPEKDMYEPAMLGFLGPSKFSKVTRAIGTMGDALSDIASGIKDWADLKIPVYKKGSTEVETYVTLSSESFVKATENIKEVVSCLSQAIIDIYEENPEMFSSGWLTDSPFTNVLDAIGPMGDALSDIAKGVQSWADLKIPIYKEGSTEIQSYVSLTDDMFEKVGQNIDKVVTILISSVAGLYDKHDNWFNGGLFTDSPIAKVLDSIEPLGSSLKDIADAVQAWADLKIPVYEGGKIAEYVSLTDNDFDKVARNVDKVVTILISSVAGLYDKHDNWFDGTGFLGMGDSPIGKVLGSMAPLGKALKDIADAVQAWAELKIPIYEGKEIIGYKALGNTDFVNATNNINLVVTSLVRSVAALYYDAQAQNEGWFEGGFWTGDSPIAKVLGSIEPLGQCLKGIADAITAFADFKIPIYGKGANGEAVITGYATLTDGQIVTASENIAKIVTALVKSVASLYFLPEAQTEKWFDTESWFLIETNQSPIGKVLTAIEPLGKTLASIAAGIKDFADFKIPIYGKNGKGELIITGYKTLADNDFKQCADNIGTILTVLGNSISKVVKDNPTIFGKGANDNSSGVAKAAEAIKLAGDTLASVATVIGYYATGEFPILTYDKNGKLTQGKMVKMNVSKINDMKKRVSMVLCALGQAIIDVYNDPKANKEIWSQWEVGGMKKDSPAMIIAGSISAISDALNKVIETIQKIVEFNFEDINNKLNSQNGVRDMFKNVITGIADIYNVIGGEGVITVNNKLIEENYAKWATNMGVYLDPTKTSVNSISKTIEKVFEASSNIIKSFEKYNDELIKLLDKDKEDPTKYIIVSNIEKILTVLSNILYNISESKISSSLLNFDDKKFIEILNTSTRLIRQLSDKAIEINKYNDKLQNIDFSNVTEGISKFITCVKTINATLNSNTSQIDTSGAKELLTSTIESLSNNDNKSIDDLVKDVTAMSRVVRKIIGLGQTAEDLKVVSYSNIAQGIGILNTALKNVQFDANMDRMTNDMIKTLFAFISTVQCILIPERFVEQQNVLRDGILNIYAAASQIQDNQIFAKFTSDVNKFIQAINNVKLNNVKFLTDLVNAMNTLSQRLGNMDNLTDAIANKLSAVLFELVNQLRKAEATITNAHKLQEKRKKLMEESMQKIERIMNNHMIVEISQVQDENNGGDASINNTPINTDATGDNGGTPPSSDTGDKLNNPENATATTKPGSTPPASTEGNLDVTSTKPLTMAQFNAYMKKNFSALMNKHR